MKDKIQLVVRILFGLMFINSGLNKIFQYMPMPEGMTESMLNLYMAFVESGWLIPLLAVAEIIGGILFIVPKFKAFGAIIIFPVVVGILCTHLVNDRAGLPIAIVLLVINVWVIIDNKDKYMHMIK